MTNVAFFLKAANFLAAVLLCALLIRFFILERGQKITLRIRIATLAQELFVAHLQLFLFLLFRSSSIAGLLIFTLLPLYLFLDASLYQKTKYRMELSFFTYLRGFRSFKSSFQEMQVGKIFLQGLFFILGSSLLFDLLKRDLPNRGLSPWLLLSFAICGILSWKMPVSYSLDQALFRFFRKKIKSQREFKKKADFLHLPKLFQIRIKKEEKPHLVFVMMESFRSLDVGCLGKDRGVTPHFDKLAQEGFLFTQFYANAVQTKRAAEACLSGLPPLMRSKEYQTVYMHNGYLAFEGQKALFKDLGYEKLIERNDLVAAFPYALGNSWGVYDEYLMQYAGDFLQKEDEEGRSCFLTLATMTNHHPWTLPPHHTPPHFSETGPYKRYLQTFHYSDHALGLFVEHLRKTGLSRRTILFILGDHGQPMGEHRDNFLPQQGLYEENVRIPLLIIADGRIKKPMQFSHICSQIDLLPTVMDLFGISGEAKGKSLRRTYEERSAFFQSPFGLGYAGCRSGKYKYIFTQTTREEELFDLEKDPSESCNLAEIQPELVRQFREQTHALPAEEKQRESLSGEALPNPKHLLLSHSLQITDELLEQKLSSDLEIVDLSHCLLLTDRGIRTLWKRSPYLERAVLREIEELTDGAFEAMPILPKLFRIDLLGCPRITDQTVKVLASSCPHLQMLALCCRNISTLSPFISSHRQFIALHIQQGHHLKDEDLIAFIENNPQLQHLILDECWQLTDRFLACLHQMTLIKLRLFSCPQFSEQGLLSLKELPVSSLSFVDCAVQHY